VFGGEVLQIEAAQPLAPELITDVAEVQSARQTSPRGLLAVVADAGVATPRVMATLTAAGIDVLSMEEYQPTFDEVFAELVRARRAARDAAGEGDVAA
jgi:hypothetical protein